MQHEHQHSLDADALRASLLARLDALAQASARPVVIDMPAEPEPALPEPAEAE